MRKTIIGLFAIGILLSCNNDFFPSQLLNEKKTTIGCPDCADGGGLFIQYSENGNVKSWRIDQEKDNVPHYLHNLIDKVNEKIKIINGIQY